MVWTIFIRISGFPGLLAVTHARQFLWGQGEAKADSSSRGEVSRGKAIASRTTLGLYQISAPAPARIRHCSKSGRNLAPAKIPPEPDSFAGFEKLIFSRH